MSLFFKAQIYGSISILTKYSFAYRIIIILLTEVQKKNMLIQSIENEHPKIISTIHDSNRTMLKNKKLQL